MTSTTDEYALTEQEALGDIADFLPYFYELAKRDDVRDIIELGVREGHSTRAFLAGLAASGGHLWSVDCEPTHELDADEHWTFIHGDDCDPAVLAQLPAPVDVVFIDTDHAFHHTQRELELYGRRVRPGGLILLHDTGNEHPEDHGVRIPPQPPFPVLQAMQWYSQTYRYPAHIDERGWGLGTVMVKPIAP